MAADSDIEWTDAIWPIVDGCEHKSPGCNNCWAERQIGTRFRHLPRFQGLTVLAENGRPKWTGVVRCQSDLLDVPLRRRTPTRYFVAPRGDLFHDDVPDEYIAAVFGVMAACPQHTFQVLTKRAERLPRWFEWIDGRPKRSNPALDCQDYMHAIGGEGIALTTTPPWPLPNVHLGVSVEDQQRADERIPHLLAVPAAVRWVSAEPLLGAVRLDDGENGWLSCDGRRVDGVCCESDALGGEHFRGIDWVVVGGESGPGARPMHPAWARSIRDQCVEAGVPYFFKQHGAWEPFYERDRDDPDWRNVPKEKPNVCRLNLAGGQGFHGDEVVYFRNVGKKTAGRLLDRRTWDEMPDTDR